MSDCPNADIRDQLPDLLHGHLDAASRARVESHVRECAACRQELEMLRRVRASVQEVPVDVARIVSALPAPSVRRRRTWNARVWQMAAAVVFLTAGGSAIARYVSHAGVHDSTRTGVVASRGDSEAATNGAGDVELSVGYGYSDLTDAQLESLLKDVEHITAVPLAEPEATVPNVTVTNGGI